MARRKSQLTDKIDINMTPMIDVVFQLMSFFMCSLKIVAPEGDFDIRMPLGKSAASVVDEDLSLSIIVKLAAGADGDLARIIVNGNPVPDFAELQRLVVSLVGKERGPDSRADRAEVELDCDYGLKYVNVVRAITAVSATVQDGQIVELIKKIKFTPPKAGP